MNNFKPSEYRKQQEHPMLGKTHSEESKRKLSEANKGRGLGTKRGTKFSDEHRAKMSIAAKTRYARKKLS